MKKITVKIKADVLNDERQMRNLIGAVQKVCIPGTCNLQRLGLRQMSFKINDASENKIKAFSAFEQNIKVMEG
jgi:hypothetical protein